VVHRVESFHLPKCAIVAEAQSFDEGKQSKQERPPNGDFENFEEFKGVVIFSSL